jgi:hypothetical protein
MTLKGADLLAWAERKAHEHEHGPGTSVWVRPTLATTIAGAYLRGAIDALAEEAERIRNAAAVGRLGDAAITSEGKAVGP